MSCAPFPPISTVGRIHRDERGLTLSPPLLTNFLESTLVEIAVQRMWSVFPVVSHLHR